MSDIKAAGIIGGSNEIQCNNQGFLTIYHHHPATLPARTQRRLNLDLFLEGQHPCWLAFLRPCRGPLALSCGDKIHCCCPMP